MNCAQWDWTDSSNSWKVVTNLFSLSIERLDELEMLEKVSWKSSNYLVWWRCLPSPLPPTRRKAATRHLVHYCPCQKVSSLWSRYVVAHCTASQTKYVQGVEVKSGKSLSSKFGRNQCLYWNKWYTRRKPLISALIWPLESDCSLKNVSYTFHRRQEVKNPFRGHKIQQNMLFAVRGRGALLIGPRPLLGCQIKAEIQGFLLMYRMFLY